MYARLTKKYICIEAAIPSKLAIGTSTKVVFDHDAWAEILAKKERDYPSLRVTGWYHTHPRVGVFFQLQMNSAKSWPLPTAGR